jgi:hypothetical protein
MPCEKDQCENILAPGAHGHADSDLLGAAAGSVRHDSIQPDGCQQQRDGGEDGKQRSEKSNIAALHGEEIVKGNQALGRQILVHVFEGAAKGI